jgi:osmotically-inducible protein OsmY
MKLKSLSALLILVAGPVALFASSDTDHKIEDAAKASYNYRTVLADHVKVKVDHGVVTLSGVVQDRDERALAEDTVDNLPGVQSVVNQIVITPTYPEHSDAWIAFKIRGQLLVKANVSAAATTVAVQDGVVTLGGTADSQAQKELTEVYAREIDWVKSVKNDIVVQAAPTVTETVGENIDDASITTQVKYALLSHKATSALSTKVTTTDGVSVISGEAANDAEKALVTRLAQDIRGVKSVTNNMTVKS